MASELPYVIVYVVLFFIIIGLALYIMDQYIKLNGCETNPDIWCYNTYTCQVTCGLNTATPPVAVNGAGQPVNICFNSTAGFDGLPECLYGANSAQATPCIPTAATPDDPDTPACPCAIGGTSNCLAGCPQSVSAVAQGTTCCCADCPGTSTGCNPT